MRAGKSPPRPELEKLLDKSRRKVAAMTSRQKKRMLEKQAESFSRQDKD